MATIVYLWTNNNPTQWTKLTGTAFYQFLQTPAARGRFFIKMNALHANEPDLIIECTEQESICYKQERNRTLYLQERNKDISVSPFSALEEQENQKRSIDDVIPDPQASIEELVDLQVGQQQIRDYIKLLDPIDTAILSNLICALHGQSTVQTQNALAIQFGITKSAVSHRKNKILKNLKKLLNF